MLQTSRSDSEHETRLEFVRAAFAIGSFVVVTNATERYGKGYCQVVTKMRCRLSEQTVRMMLYISNNSTRSHFARNSTGKYDDGELPNPKKKAKVSGTLTDEDDDEIEDEAFDILEALEIVPDNLDAQEKDSDEDENATDDDELDDFDEEEEEYNLPDGWEEKEWPVQGLDKDCVGKWIMMKWEGWGWALGKLVKFNNPQTRQGKKFNFQVSYPSDDEPGTRPTWLDATMFGNKEDDAPYGSWLLVGP